MSTYKTRYPVLGAPAGHRWFRLLRRRAGEHALQRHAECECRERMVAEAVAVHVALKAAELELRRINKATFARSAGARARRGAAAQ